VIGAVTPAPKIGMLLLACAMLALAGCDLAEQAASFMPKTSRQAGPEPAPPNPEPDAKELVRANADTLFTAHPTALAVSPPKSITGRGYSVCVKAVVAGPMDPAPQPITLFVIIERGKLADRRRALPQDGCARETYEKAKCRRAEVVSACSFEVNAESGTRRMRWTILTRARLRIGKPDQRTSQPHVFDVSKGA